MDLSVKYKSHFYDIYVTFIFLKVKGFIESMDAEFLHHVKEK